MQTVLQALTTLAALLVPLATIIGLLQSQAWLTLLTALAVLILAGVAFWAFHTKRRVSAASVEIEGISIDCTNAANLRRRVNRSLMVQTAEHTATIIGQDLEIAWHYSGYCRARTETSMEFSIDADKSVPFGDLDCQAFDLRHDPGKKHPIRPLLIGPDSISKKITVPFLRQLTAHEPFDLLLRCRMPNTYMPGTCYYTSTLSFDQNRVPHSRVNLRFSAKPAWIRVYSVSDKGRPKLLRSLYPHSTENGFVEFCDITENAPAKSVRIYLFKLDAV
jgi:hypothetical protein